MGSFQSYEKALSVYFQLRPFGASDSQPLVSCIPIKTSDSLLQLDYTSSELAFVWNLNLGFDLKIFTALRIHSKTIPKSGFSGS